MQAPADELQKLPPLLSASALSLSRNSTRGNTPSRTVVFKDARGGDDGLEKCFLRVMGMTCGSCVNAIERGLSRVEGKTLPAVRLLKLLFTP